MRPPGQFTIIALVLALALPSPALALREPSPLEQRAQNLAGLEEALRPTRRLRPLRDEVNLERLAPRVIYPHGVEQDLSSAKVVVVTADGGKGTRFHTTGGKGLKVLAPVGGLPAGIRTKLAALALSWPVIAVVGHAADQVMAAYNAQTQRGVIYVESKGPAGGTGYAFYHAAAVKGLRNSEALVIATLGDQPLFDRDVLKAVEQTARTSGADLVIASAIFDDPKGKGRIVRERGTGKILGILEQRDIEGGATLGGYSQAALLAIREGNVSIYAMPARRFFDALADTTTDNDQKQYYVTDIVERVLKDGGRVEAVRVPATKALDITNAHDLQRAEAALAQHAGLEEPPTVRAATAADAEAIRQSLADSPVRRQQKVLAWYQSSGHLDRHLGDESRVTLVAVQGGRVVGGLFAVRIVGPRLPGSLEALQEAHVPSGMVVVPYLVWSSAPSPEQRMPMAKTLVLAAKAWAERVGALEVVTYSPLTGAKAWAEKNFRSFQTSNDIEAYLTEVLGDPAVRLHTELSGVLDLERYPPTPNADPNDAWSLGARAHFVYPLPRGIAQAMLEAEGAKAKLAEQGFVAEAVEGEMRFLVPADKVPTLPGAIYAHSDLFPTGTINGASYIPLARDHVGVTVQLTDTDHPSPQDLIIFDRALVGEADWRPDAAKATPAIVVAARNRSLGSGDIAYLSEIAHRLGQDAKHNLLIVRTVAFVTVDEHRYLFVATQA